MEEGEMGRERGESNRTDAWATLMVSTSPRLLSKHTLLFCFPSPPCPNFCAWDARFFVSWRTHTTTLGVERLSRDTQCDDIQQCRKVEHTPASTPAAARHLSGLSIFIGIARTVRSSSVEPNTEPFAESSRQTTLNDSTHAGHATRPLCGQTSCADISQGMCVARRTCSLPEMKLLWKMKPISAPVEALTDRDRTRLSPQM